MRRMHRELCFTAFDLIASVLERFVSWKILLMDFVPLGLETLQLAFFLYMECILYLALYLNFYAGRVHEICIQ